jgi:hypothetical protein
MTITQSQIVPMEERQLADFSPARVAVRELVARLKAGLKIKDATENEYIALATMSMAHNLDPFNGECWIIPGNGVMAGIKGLRKAADSQLPDGAYRNPILRLLQHSEYTKYAIPEDAELAALCELTRSDATQKWVAQLSQLTAMGMPYEEALKNFEPRPVWIGVGIVKKGEKSRMARIQLVFKRAEADAMKKAFNLPFNIDLSNEGFDSEPIEGEYVEAPEAQPEPQAETAEEAPSLTRPYLPEVVRRGIQSRVSHNPTAHDKTASSKQQSYVAQLLSKAFEGSATLDKDRHSVQLWLIGKESVKTFSAAEAAAVIEWLADDTGDLGYDGALEAQAILRQALIDEGQTELPGMPEAA